MGTYYKNIVEGTFINRPNRFIANVLIDGKTETVHVKNTGRCKEILKEGVKVYLEKSDNPARKTAYDLIAVYKGDMLINIDSQLPNAVAAEYVASGGMGITMKHIKRECTYGDSRFDIYAVSEDNREYLIEVKGVTLEEDGIASFPDAPTTRGTKHVNGLARALDDGMNCCILFIVQMEGMKYLTPNDEHDPDFGKAIREAYNKGVNVKAVECQVTPEGFTVSKEIPVKLD